MSYRFFSQQNLKAIARTLFLLLTLVVTIFGSLSSTATALSPGQKKLFQEGIYYYDEDVCGPMGSDAAPANNGNVYMLGDSLMVNAYYVSKYLKEDLASAGWEASIDARGGRGMIYPGTDSPHGNPPLPGNSMAGLDAIKADKKAIETAGTVVIGLGTNETDPGAGADKSSAMFRSEMEQAIEEVRQINPTAQIYWVNISSDVTHPYTPWVREYNEVIRTVAAQKDINVINTTKSSPEVTKVNPKGVTLEPDGIHPDTAGYKTWSKVIVNAIGQAGANASDSTGSLDIRDVVDKYKLQSAMIQKVGDTEPLASYKANQPPVAPASTMKLVIADVALQSGLNLDKTVPVTSELYYDGSNDLGKSSITLREAMTLMLSRSSNVAANVLMKAMGGVDAFTQKAQNYGYNNTDVVGYYDPANSGKNSSTISDQVTAMNHIFSTKGSDYQEAQDALKDAAQNDNYYGVDDVANKWAGTSQVAGNVGLFDINGAQYIVGLYYNGGSDSSKNIIKGATTALVDILGNADPSAGADQCCPPIGEGDVTSLTGKDNIERTINFFLQKGLSLEQAAGLAANFAWETGGGINIDPLVSGPTPKLPAWGIAQWTAENVQVYIDDKEKNDIRGSDAELLTQLEVVWAQIQGKGAYNSGQSILPGLKKITNAGEAATYFRENFERCDTANSSCTTDRVATANEFFSKYNGGSLSGGFVSGESSTCSGGSASQPGTVSAAVDAAKRLSEMKLGYVWGGLHGPEQLDITNTSKLQQLGADCSGSVGWVLHQAGMLGSTSMVSGGFETWGQAGKGKQMTVWANAQHVYIEFNVPGMGVYELNTSYNEATVAPEGIPSTTPGATGPGPRFFKATPNASYYTNPSGFTPRHWPGT